MTWTAAPAPAARTQAISPEAAPNRSAPVLAGSLLKIDPGPFALGRRLLRRAMGLLVVLALALAGLSATTPPARASDSDDLVRFLLGAAAFAIIVRAIDETRPPRYIAPTILPNACLATLRVRGREVDVYDEACLRRAGYRALPRQCEVRYRGPQTFRLGFEARCLYRAGYRAEWTPPICNRPAPPPRACEIWFWENGSWRIGYDPRCLERHRWNNLNSNPGGCPGDWNTVYSPNTDTCLNGNCVSR